METNNITLRTLTALKKALLLQRELYATFHDLTAQGDDEHAEYFARAAFEVGVGFSELETLFNTLGHRLPWDNFYKQE